MEAMDLESARCAPLLTSAFQAHCELRMREAAALGPAGEETAAELQLLTEWTRAAREVRRGIRLTQRPWPPREASDSIFLGSMR